MSYKGSKSSSPRATAVPELDEDGDESTWPSEAPIVGKLTFSKLNVLPENLANASAENNGSSVALSVDSCFCLSSPRRLEDRGMPAELPLDLSNFGVEPLDEKENWLDLSARKAGIEAGSSFSSPLAVLAKKLKAFADEELKL